MSSTSQESVCQRICDLRRRLELLKARETSPIPLKNQLRWSEFREDWEQGWQRIWWKLQEIDRALNDPTDLKNPQSGPPAILQFPPAEDSACSMERD